MSLMDAHTLVRACRPIIRPNCGFWKQLIDYERSLRGTNSVMMVASPLGYPITLTCTTYLLREQKQVYSTEPTATRCLVLRGLPVILGDDASMFFKSSSVTMLIKVQHGGRKKFVSQIFSVQFSRSF
ncbi:hypothetical protein KOW79_018257 [Hemibagrus wyckioides]|uniref:Uncharacterized protein n=1 Tax=Hemibagrus wyckioides TaxID=337641 RepID=A0A9D3SC22_9TELE|nr:hypothetical protein KOW79_018257 [Hemibagrus wyckioides]